MIVGTVNSTSVAPVTPTLPSVTGCYASSADLAVQHGAANVMAWADKDNDGNVASIAAAILDGLLGADRYIDDFFRPSMYSVPLSPIDVVVVNWAVELACERIYKQRGMRDDASGIAGKINALADEARSEMCEYRDGTMRGLYAKRFIMPTAPTWEPGL